MPLRQTGLFHLFFYCKPAEWRTMVPSKQRCVSYLVNWSSRDLVLNITDNFAVGVCWLAEQTGLLSSCISANLPSCHRAAFPPLFAQLIPFPYKECERQRAAKKDEITASLPFKISVKSILQDRSFRRSFYFKENSKSQKKEGHKYLMCICSHMKYALRLKEALFYYYF